MSDERKLVKLVNSNTWKPSNQGDTLEGIFDRSVKTKFRDKISLAHVILIETPKGPDEKKVFGADLDKVMCLIDKGTFVKIIYKGSKNLGDYRNLRLFDVLIDEKDIERLELNEDNYEKYETVTPDNPVQDVDDPESQNTIDYILDQIGAKATAEQIVEYAKNDLDLTGEDLSRVKIQAVKMRSWTYAKP